jgi:hypothetical protein
VAGVDAGSEAWGEGEGDAAGGPVVPQPAASSPAAASAASRTVRLIFSPAKRVAALCAASPGAGPLGRAVNGQDTLPPVAVVVPWSATW